MSDINEKLQKLLIQQREEQYYHSSFAMEHRLYEAVQSGDFNQVIYVQTHGFSGEMGILSENSLQNIRYHFVIGVSLLCRFCVQAGMDLEEAYTLSDLYIQKMDHMNDADDIQKLLQEARKDYTKRMGCIQKNKLDSKPVMEAKAYVSSHLTEHITVEEIARQLSLHPDYLSRQFHKQMGITLSAYVSQKRIEAAKYMMLESDASCTEIASFLGFSSCSHFIGTFKKFEQVTPMVYRKNNYRKRLEI